MNNSIKKTTVWSVIILVAVAFLYVLFRPSSPTQTTAPKVAPTETPVPFYQDLEGKAA